MPGLFSKATVYATDLLGTCIVLHYSIPTLFVGSVAFDGLSLALIWTRLLKPGAFVALDGSLIWSMNFFRLCAGKRQLHVEKITYLKSVCYRTTEKS
jgi:hypothetical protein